MGIEWCQSNYYLGRGTGLEPALSYFDRRQTIVVVLFPFEKKNTTRLQCFPFASYLHCYIHRSKYNWETPLPAKARTKFPVVYRTLFFSFALRPVTCGDSNLKHLFIDYFIHLLKNKLEHGEHIHKNLFNSCRSRRTVLGVLISERDFVSYSLSSTYEDL